MAPASRTPDIACTSVPQGSQLPNPDPVPDPLPLLLLPLLLLFDRFPELLLPLLDVPPEYWPTDSCTEPSGSMPWFGATDWETTTSDRLGLDTLVLVNWMSPSKPALLRALRASSAVRLRTSG